MGLHRFAASSALLWASVHLSAQQLPEAITTDPALDKVYPAAMETFQIPSHGAMLNALAYIAEGAGPHPVVLLLHGFPGNEKNLDLAQAIRRDGWDVVYFDYRGSWGSPGDFSFTHSIEDTQSAIAYLRDSAHAKKLRSDPADIVSLDIAWADSWRGTLGHRTPESKPSA
jgi:predicted alpha/beta-fold hydrolase